jgi:hypothetical protein
MDEELFAVIQDADRLVRAFSLSDQLEAMLAGKYRVEQPSALSVSATHVADYLRRLSVAFEAVGKARIGVSRG